MVCGVYRYSDLNKWVPGIIPYQGFKKTLRKKSLDVSKTKSAFICEWLLGQTSYQFDILRTSSITKT